MITHRPHGSGHPYRFELDQRVPPRPGAGEEFEIRALADPDITEVTAEFSDGTRVQAIQADPEQLLQDIGPFPAKKSADGHLASAAEASRLNANARVWVVRSIIDKRAEYKLTGRRGAEIITTDTFGVDPLRWTADSVGAVQVDGDAPTRLDTDAIMWQVGSDGPVKVRFRLRLDPGQHIIGLGERFATLDHRGEVLDAVVFEQYKHQGRRTYLPVPMAAVVGGDHWGFHVNTTRRTWFDLGAADPDWITIEAEVDPLSPTLLVSLWAGTPASVVDRFLQQTGAPKRPPSWIFEPWMSGNEWNTQVRVEAEVARSMAENISVGVVVIEAWSDESTFVAWRDATYDVHLDGSPHRLSDFTFPSTGAWPDPVGMVERLHRQGVKVLLWQIPLVPTDRGDRGQIAADVVALQQRKLCIREADGSAHTNRGWWFPGALIPDFTNAETRRWWREKRRYLLEEVGVDGFKTDGGEHPWGHDILYADGTTGAQTNNRFPVLFAQTFHELLDETRTDGVTFSRAGFTGSAAFPCHWAGDDDSTWDGLRASLRAGLSAGVAGIWFWTWDLAGFSGPLPDAELYLRAAAVSAFCPIMQYHAEFNDHRVPGNDRTPWNMSERTGDSRVLPVFRHFAEIRHRLVPYLEEQTGRSLATGKPLMRPLCFDHPDDAVVWEAPLQFLLGDDLLVVPITEAGQTQIRGYVPAGQWVDCFSGAPISGPTWVERDVPMDEIAVYRRVGGSAALEGVFS